MKKKYAILGLLAIVVLGVIITPYFYNGYKTVSKNTLPGRDREECGKCHNNLAGFNLKVKHTPFVEWKCKDCHTKHDSTTNKTSYTTDLNKLCLTCHQEYKLASAFPSQHQPFQNGMCIDCHNPHASDNNKLLLKPANEICQSCHSSKYKYKEYSFKHKPYENGNCSDCHVPHYSKNKALTILPGKQLCFSCHFSSANENSLPNQHPPFASGNCTDCHYPHAAPAAKMLKDEGNKLCNLCHSDIVNRFNNTKHTNVQGDKPKGQCLNCHVPHGTNNAPLLKNESISLCKSCHGDYGSVGIGHPVDKNTKDPWGGGYLRCASCHDPHGTKYPTLLKEEKGDNLCIKCHGDKKKK